MFTAVQGRTYLSDIAIDDVSLTPGCKPYSGVLPTAPPTQFPPPTTAVPNNCNSLQYGCVTTGQCIDIKKYCDFNVDCTDGSDEWNCSK